MVTVATKNPVTISTVRVTLDVMKGWKGTGVRMTVDMDIMEKIAKTNAVQTAS